MLTFQQSESTAERRRWIIVLVDSTDGVTGLTGQTGTVKISKNGGAAANSTNSIVEVDAGDMPGHYYIELTAAELDTLGHISITKKTAGSLAFHDRAIVSYNDPYISAGGFASGGGSGFRLTDKHIEAIAKKVWEYQIQEDVLAKDKLIQAADHPVVDLEPITSGIKSIVIPEVDLSGLSEQISNIEIPKPVDYTKLLSDLKLSIDGFKAINTDGVQKAVSEFNSKMAVATKEINSSLGTVQEIKDGFSSLLGLVNQFNDKVAEMSDMDKRFENMTSTMQKQQLDDLITKIDRVTQQILVKITDTKFDILTELKD